MRNEDKAIWERFIQKNPGYFDEVEFDVHVGSKPDFDTNVVPGSQSDVGNIYQRKIDVVGYSAGNIYIVELKPLAGSSALGQVKSYEILYRRDFKPEAKTICVVITDFIGTDMEELADSMGVLLIEA